jgi:hypothetical protein
LLLLQGNTKTSPGVGAETEDLEPIQSDISLVTNRTEESSAGQNRPLHNLKAILYGATNSEPVDVLTATHTTALP